MVAVLKAHGVDPRWREGAYKDLSADCQQRFRDINLQAAVERLEGGKTFDPKDDALDKVSRILRVPAEQRFADGEDPARECATSH